MFHVDRVPLALRPRKAVAGGLRHLADVVAPRPVRHPPVLSGACRGQADVAATASADRGSGTGTGHRKWLKKERGDHPGPCCQLPTAEPPGRGGRSGIGPPGRTRSTTYVRGPRFVEPGRNRVVTMKWIAGEHDSRPLRRAWHIRDPEASRGTGEHTSRSDAGRGRRPRPLSTCNLTMLEAQIRRMT